MILIGSINGHTRNKMTTIELRNGDCVEKMRELEDGSLASLLCDPPYGLKFFTHKGGFDNLGDSDQQKEWHKQWLLEAYRVLKPNGVIRAFSSPRTLHHLISAMVDVGFERVSVNSWLYVSGRPKTIDVAKSITAFEKLGSASQLGFHELAKGYKRDRLDIDDYVNKGKFFSGVHQEKLDFELTENGEKWKGWQYGLKPSFEPVVIGFKRELN